VVGSADRAGGKANDRIVLVLNPRLRDVVEPYVTNFMICDCFDEISSARRLAIRIVSKHRVNPVKRDGAS
jgi:hypothetical protein